MVHQVYSAGVNINRVYMPYGVSSTGVFQILDPEQAADWLLPVSANPVELSGTVRPQADLLYPADQLYDDESQSGRAHLYSNLRSADSAIAA